MNESARPGEGHFLTIQRIGTSTQPPDRADATTASVTVAARAPSAKVGKPSGRLPRIAAYVSATTASKQS